MPPLQPGSVLAGVQWELQSVASAPPPATNASGAEVSAPRCRHAVLSCLARSLQPLCLGVPSVPAHLPLPSLPTLLCW